LRGEKPRWEFRTTFNAGTFPAVRPYSRHSPPSACNRAAESAYRSARAWIRSSSVCMS